MSETRRYSIIIPVHICFSNIAYRLKGPRKKRTKLNWKYQPLFYAEDVKLTGLKCSLNTLKGQKLFYIINKSLSRN